MDFKTKFCIDFNVFEILGTKIIFLKKSAEQV
jgi:hypothetical protein